MIILQKDILLNSVVGTLKPFSLLTNPDLYLLFIQNMVFSLMNNFHFSSKYRHNSFSQGGVTGCLENPLWLIQLGICLDVNETLL